MIPKPLAVAIVCLITLVWIGNFAAQFLVPGYQSDGWVHAIFFATVGAALGLSRKGEGNEPPRSGGVSVASILRSFADVTDPPTRPNAPAPPDDPPTPEPPPRAELRPSRWRYAT